MKKEEFLKLLRKKIFILKKEEQDDIINEYKEHIEEKLKKNIKEETIIKELGDVDTLAKEILDAYKINEDYKTNKSENNFFSTCNKVIEKIVEKFENKSLKDIMKFIIEIIVILLLIAILKLPFLLIESLGSNLFIPIFEPLESILRSIWNFLIEICYLIVAFFTFINIFKIRYFNENDIKDIKKKPKPVEKAIKDKKPINKSNKKFDILHSFFKVLLVLISIPFVFSLIFLLVSLGVIVFFGIKSNFFIGMLLCDLALILGNIYLLNIFYRIIFDKPLKFLRMLIIFISVTVAFALGILLSIYEISRISIIEDKNVLKTTIKEKEISLSKDKVTNIMCDECRTQNQILQYDNTLNNKAKVKVEYYKDMEKAELDDSIPNHLYVYKNYKIKNNVDMFFENLKENKILNYPKYNNIRVTVCINEKDLYKINFANNNYYLNGIFQGNPNEIDY